MNRQILDRETRRHLRYEAEWLVDQELRAMDQIEATIIRLGYGDNAPRFIQSPSTEHAMILTERVVVYNPYTGIQRVGAQLLGLSILPIKTLAWVVDSMVYGFTKDERYGDVVAPSILWDLTKFPGESYSLRRGRPGHGCNTRKGGYRYDRKY